MSTSEILSNYTDYHDVDEDLRAITFQGGSWLEFNHVGVMDHDLDDPPSHVSMYVASLKK